MISPDNDIAGYVQFVIIKRETRVQVCFRKAYDVCTAKNAFKSCTLEKLWAEMLFRFQ